MFFGIFDVLLELRFSIFPDDKCFGKPEPFVLFDVTDFCQKSGNETSCFLTPVAC